MDTNTSEQILSIFTNNEDKEKISQLIDIDIKIPIGMTEYQINNFVLNKKEFCTHLFQYQQAKMELFSRVQGFIDSYYQIREAQAKIKLSEGRIEELNNINNTNTNNTNTNNTNINQKVREAKIDLQQIEIEKNQFKLISIEKQAKEKLREALVFYQTFNQYKYLEDLPQEELNKMEEEGWRIKSAYFPELPSRYNLTPRGRSLYPHEIGGLPLLEQLQEQMQKVQSTEGLYPNLMIRPETAKQIDEGKIDQLEWKIKKEKIKAKI